MSETSYLSSYLRSFYHVFILVLNQNYCQYFAAFFMRTTEALPIPQDPFERFMPTLTADHGINAHLQLFHGYVIY